MNLDAKLRFIELTEKSYRPPEILQLNDAIKARTRVAELKYISTGLIDQEEINSIVGMKRQLDALYIKWAEGRIE